MSEKLRIVKELVRDVYLTSGNGGCAHIVLDDYNVEDAHIHWCLGYCAGIEHGRSDPEDDRGDIATQEECLNALLKIPYKQRKKLIKEAKGLGL